MSKYGVCEKEKVSITEIISKYSRKRLYQILNETIGKSDLIAVEKEKIKRENYCLLADRDKIFFQPAKTSNSYPLLFSIEDIKNNSRSYLNFSPLPDKKQGIFKIIDGGFLLKAERLNFTVDIVVKPEKDYLLVRGRVKAAKEAVFRIGVELNIDAVGWNWYRSIRNVQKIEKNGQYFLYSRDYNLGKNGGLPYYSFGNISNGNFGLILGVEPQEPRVFEITYDAKQKSYCLFFDMAVSPKTKNFPNEASFSAFLLPLEGNGADFRQAFKKYYQLFPQTTEKRVEKEGNWMPFCDIAGVEKAEDFCFAYHELNIFYDGSLRSKADIDYNVSKGIYNFAYTEPWLYWVQMPRDMERTYKNLIKLVEENLGSDDEKIREFASAGLTSAIKDSEGNYYVRFMDAPWCCGAVFNTNTDPALKTDSKCWVNRAEIVLRQVIRALKDPRFHGIYLDSMQAVELIHDYDENHFETVEFPLTFEKDKKKPVICQFISAYHLTELLADYLHAQGKLLMGNFPTAFTFFMQHVDVPGEEIGWIENGRYKPMSDEDLIVRRALSCRRPYVFLQSVNFDEFNKDMVDKYMQRCLFYGMFPSMFSFNAQDAPYWQNPLWYNRDRDLFKKYLPHIISLSKAGWEITSDVKTDNEKIFIEQFGKIQKGRIFITITNQTDKLQAGKIDFSKLVKAKKTVLVKDILNNVNYVVRGNNPFIVLELKADEVILLELVLEESASLG